MNDLIAAHLLQLRAEGKSPDTILARYNVLTAADRKLPYGIDDVTTEELANYMANDDWSAWTRATYHGHLAAFYAWAATAYDGLNGNPMAEMRRPPGGHCLPDPVTDAELEHAYRESNEWWRLVIGLAANGGLRRAEVAALERTDVDALRIRIEHGKGDRARVVETHPEVWQLVESAPAGALVVSPFLHRPVPAHRLGVMARAHFDKIGLPDVHLHRLRHYFATKLVLCGVNLMVVKELMGHASLATTQLYVQITEGQRRLAVNTLPSLAGGSSKSPSARQGDSIQTLRLPAGVPTCEPLMRVL